MSSMGTIRVSEANAEATVGRLLTEARERFAALLWSLPKDASPTAIAQALKRHGGAEAWKLAQDIVDAASAGK